MDTYESASKEIETQIIGDLGDVRAQFLEHFSPEKDRFVHLMTRAYLRWKDWDRAVGDDKRKAVICAIVFSAISQHILSFRLVLSGEIVPAGNIQRQVIDAIALALLCSCDQLDILDRFINHKYKANTAVRDALRKKKLLKVKAGSLETLNRYKEFYHDYSHPTYLTLANHMSFEDEGRVIHIGAFFDEGKIDVYTREVEERVSLAGIFENFVQGVIDSVGSWKEP